MTGFGLRARLVLGGALIAGLVLMAALRVARMEIAAARARADRRLGTGAKAPYVTDQEAQPDG
ncbi:hypothetical protein, partial [Amnibacterium sp.]|uniref:hypothetical protein n=1 Tax=Amnibacterium sp. TaxID=1872496 RepID=UPI003F7B37BD